MKNRCSRKHEALLGRTIFELAEKLAAEELNLIDFLRLLDLREDLEEDGAVPLKVGWVKCPH